MTSEPSIVYVITWRYSDGSGSGATAAFTDKARAEKLVEILDKTDSMQHFKIEAVPFDFGAIHSPGVGGSGGGKEGWIRTSDRCPDAGALIVKRWKSGSVWAGVYSGTDKDSSFDEWCALPSSQATSSALQRALAGLDYFLMVKEERRFIEGARNEIASSLNAATSSAEGDACRVTGDRGTYTHGELRELAELPDAALAAAFRDVAARDYSKCWASLFRAHVIEKARAAGVMASEKAQRQDGGNA